MAVNVSSTTNKVCLILSHNCLGLLEKYCMIIIRFMEISFCFRWRKNFENRLRFDEVTAMNLMASFSLERSVN